MSSEYEMHLTDRTHKIEVKRLDDDGALSIKVDEGEYNVSIKDKGFVIRVIYYNS